MTRKEAIARLEANRDALVFEETNEALNMAIEALSADVVPIHEDGTLEVKVPNAQKVGRVLVMDPDSHIGGGLFYPEEAEAVQEWIPCSEKLPEDIKPVIVTWKNTDPKSYYQYIVGKHFIGAAHYKNGKWFWYSSVTEDLLAEYGKCDGEEFDEAIEVIAWMPLPEPYKAESEDDEQEL